MKSKYAETSLYRFWLTRLRTEYDEICLNYGVSLQPPIFEISVGEKQLGCWQSGTRSLRISERLITSYPWGITLQVLKHEMAHQYCSEVMHSQSTAHGNDFQRACSLFGVLPDFRGFSVVTEKLLDNIHDPGSDGANGPKTLSKIEKLLALGESSNIHEAEAALQKASVLIEQYHLQQLVASDHSSFIVTAIETGKKQVATYQRHICRILQEFFFVRVVLSQAYNPRLNTMQKTIELMGTRENVAIAEYCYDFLENRLALLWNEFRMRTKSCGRTQKNSYYLGVVLGFLGKLQEQDRQANVEMGTESICKELLVVEDRRLDTFVQMHFPRLRKSSSRGSRVDKDIYQKGMEVGRTLTLTKGVGSPAGDVRRLLE
ncbi:MAG: hypothetical protein ACI8ZB_004259 [Desulforhopalus sp.]|jgi:hypothetical protein